jgi:hypothetical protein
MIVGPTPCMHPSTHLLASSSLKRRGQPPAIHRRYIYEFTSGAGGGGGAVAAVGGGLLLHLAPVEAAVAPAGGARERRRRAVRARRHELAAPVHRVPAQGRRVVALALAVPHHLRAPLLLLLAPRRRAVRPPALLRPHDVYRYINLSTGARRAIDRSSERASWKKIRAYLCRNIYAQEKERSSLDDVLQLQSRPALELDGVWDFFIGMQAGRGRGSRFTRVKIEPPALLFLLKAVASGDRLSLLARGLICLRRGRTYRNSSVASTLSRAVACQCQVN